MGKAEEFSYPRSFLLGVEVVTQFFAVAERTNLWRLYQGDTVCSRAVKMLLRSSNSRGDRRMHIAPPPLACTGVGNKEKPPKPDRAFSWRFQFWGTALNNTYLAPLRRRRSINASTTPIFNPKKYVRQLPLTLYIVFNPSTGVYFLKLNYNNFLFEGTLYIGEFFPEHFGRGETCRWFPSKKPDESRRLILR